MVKTDVELLLLALGFLIILSAFFSASETSMMSLNRYKLKHHAKTSKTAALIQRMLARPDKLLSVILIGNNFVNISASAIATIIGIKLFGDMGALIATIALTIVILLFAEVTPKTMATVKSESIAFFAAYPLRALQTILYPLVAMTSVLSVLILKFIGVSSYRNSDSLTPEELKTVVNEANTLLPSKNQRMLTSILDLENISVDDIMVQKNDVVGIDLKSTLQEIIGIFQSTSHTLLPVYRGNINEIVGIIHMRNISKFLAKNDFSHEKLISMLDKPYFVPEGTQLNKQLLNFQANKSRFGIVVDEYGDILGIVTLEDILEEIVGEFTTDIAAHHTEVMPQNDGSYLVYGSANIRALNRSMNWNLPTEGAKTISGAIVEQLEMIPEIKTCVLLNGYPVEVVLVQDNTVKLCRLRTNLVK